MYPLLKNRLTGAGHILGALRRAEVRAVLGSVRTCQSAVVVQQNLKSSATGKVLWSPKMVNKIPKKIIYRTLQLEGERESLYARGRTFGRLSG